MNMREHIRIGNVICQCTHEVIIHTDSRNPMRQVVLERHFNDAGTELVGHRRVRYYPWVHMTPYRRGWEEQKGN